ncbi:unnamed protein product, partial [Rotaria sp. Silwood2]
ENFVSIFPKLDSLEW